MDVFWFWFLIILLFIAIFAWPSWPYTRNRGVYRRTGVWPYAPAGAALAAVLLILLFFWLGMIIIAWPWYAVAP
jgi:hypothetical protein